MFDGQWYQLHPVTSIVVFVALAAIAHFNFRCQIFFGPGGTSALRFSHGWPFRFREAPVPGPGQLNSNPNGLLPNFIWGHPEFNDNPKIMKGIEQEISDFPRSPWQLHRLGQFNSVFALLDAVLAVILLVTACCIAEIVIRDNDLQIQSHISLWILVTLILISCASMSVVAGTLPYIVVVILVALSALAAAAQILSIGYRST
jgi:hypothetical protein